MTIGDGYIMVRRRIATRLTVEVEQEDDGRWIAEVPALAGVLAYGTTADEARAKAEALALRVLAERRDSGEPVPEVEGLFVATNA
jgi:predicted RNase H-like HicB family nuclease